MNYNRIVFLDFDGVMTAISDGSSHICGNPSSYRMSTMCKKWLSKLWNKMYFPDVKIVLSTNWLKFSNFETACWYSPDGKKYNCQINELISWLMDEHVYLDNVSYSSDSSKFGRIMSWIIKNRGYVNDSTKFLILDDDSSRYNLLNLFNVCDEVDYGKTKFICVDPQNGFDEKCLNEAIEFFRKEV